MNKQIKTHRVLGLMSGTSLDGLDLCIADFQLGSKEQWEFEILATETIAYSKNWVEKLQNADQFEGRHLINLHFSYGKLLGEISRRFISKCRLTPKLIASHGHTLFHETERGFTFQLGHPAAIAAETGINVVGDFRSLDLALGGEGAPLVPFGDKQLFPQYTHCLNFGGICNTSFQNPIDQRIAFDICPFNMVLNFLSQKHFNLGFDDGGEIAASGNFHQTLFEELNQLDYYRKKPPKSIGKEWVYEKVIPLLNNNLIPAEDKLHTFSKHIVFQIKKSLPKKDSPILITGGGAKNNFIFQLLQKDRKRLILPSETLIDFKEALIFAFLGLKRQLEETNLLCSSTGSKRDSCSGSIFLA